MVLGVGGVAVHGLRITTLTDAIHAAVGIRGGYKGATEALRRAGCAEGQYSEKVLRERETERVSNVINTPGRWNLPESGRERKER